jgi:hypothetical protein
MWMIINNKRLTHHDAILGSQVSIILYVSGGSAKEIQSKHTTFFISPEISQMHQEEQVELLAVTIKVQGTNSR